MSDWKRERERERERKRKSEKVIWQSTKREERGGAQRISSNLD